jgi:hypothetical protein
VLVEILIGKLNRRGKYKADKDGGTEMWWGKMKKRGNN